MSGPLATDPLATASSSSRSNAVVPAEVLQ